MRLSIDRHSSNKIGKLEASDWRSRVVEDSSVQLSASTAIVVIPAQSAPEGRKVQWVRINMCRTLQLTNCSNCVNIQRAVLGRQKAERHKQKTQYSIIHLHTYSTQYARTITKSRGVRCWRPTLQQLLSSPKLCRVNHSITRHN